jgi:MFS family permease
MSSDAESGFSHQQILTVVRGVALCILLAALDQTIIVPAVPKMAAALGGARHIGWIVAAYLLTGTAATPIFGRLSDIYGRPALLRPALVIFVLASLGCAAAQNFWQLAALRAVQGIGGAGLITVAQIAIADVASPRQRGRYQIYMSGVWGIASISGPIAGGLLADHLSWRAIFWINLPLGALAWVLSMRALRILPAPDAGAPAAGARRIDFLGAALLTVSVTLLLLLLSGGGQDFAWMSRVSAGLLTAGAAVVAVTIWQQNREVAPMLPPRLFTDFTLAGGFIISAANAFAMFGGTLLLPLYFQFIRHTSASGSGLLTTPFMLAFVVWSYAGGQISRWLGRTKAIMLAALAVCLAGLLLLASMGPHTPLGLCILYMVLLGSGIGLVQPNLTVTIQNAAARRDVGIATGCMLLFRAIGGAFGAALAASALRASGFAAAFLVCAAASVAAIAVAAVMRETRLRS